MANVIKHKRGSGSDPVANNLVVGELAIRTDTGKLFTKMDSGALAEIAGGGSDIAINTLSSSSGTGGGSATFNGSAFRFTLSSPPSVSAQQLLVSINGVIQKPVAGTGQPSEGFSVDGTDIILGDAPAAGSDFFILTFRSLGVSVPADNSVTSAKIVDGTIVNADINASAAIARTKLVNVDVVDDTSPQLGGNLQSNGNNINIADSTDGATNRLTVGSGGDLQIYHTGTQSIIQDTGTGNLNLQGSSKVVIGNAAIDENMAQFFADGAVELYHNNSKKFETTSTGIDVNGSITADDLRTDNSQTFFLTSASDFRFRHTGGTERMRIDTSGNVGIGTTSPTSTGIQSGIKTVQIDSGDGAELILGNSQSSNVSTNHIGAIAFKNIDTTTGAAPHYAGIRCNTTSTSGGMNLKFYAGSTSFESDTPHMTIISAGNVGIGTTSPSNNLEVASADHTGILIQSDRTTASDNIGAVDFRSSSTDVARIQSLVDGTIKFRNTSSLTERMRIDSSGNVGIGTSSPSEKLHINSATTVNGLLISTTNNNTRATMGLNGKDSSGNQVDLRLGGFGDTNRGEIFTFTNHDIGFATNNAAPQMVLNTSGKVGIGTTSPSTIFHVKTLNPDIFLENTGSGTGQLRLGHFTNGAFIGTYNDDGGGSDILRFGTHSGDERMRIDSSGHLLHATTSSSAPDGNGGTLIKSDANGSFIQISKLTTQAVPAIEFYNANGRVGRIIPSGSSTSFTTNSDYRLKENAVAISDGVTRLKTLKPYKFNFKSDASTIVDGFFAHEVTAVPEAVTGTKDEVDENNEPVYQGIDQSKLVPLLVAALQEAIARIEALEAK